MCIYLFTNFPYKVLHLLYNKKFFFHVTEGVGIVDDGIGKEPNSQYKDFKCGYYHEFKFGLI